jgi:hypothetical protein
LNVDSLEDWEKAGFGFLPVTESPTVFGINP